MTEPNLVIMKGIRKSFGSVVALDGVDLVLNKRETLGLLGGNGAGKTTLMNILFGLYQPDGGEIYLSGNKLEVQSPKDAINHHIGMVHQHFLQIDSYTVTENIVLGTKLKNRPTLDLSEKETKIKDISEKFGLEVNPRALIRDLPIGVRQKVEILKALYRGIEVLILDEPTTNLTPQEVDSLFQSLRAMVEEGMSIVFITHKLREALSVCNRISVLRNGQHVLTLNREDASEEALVRGMVGERVNIENSMLFSKPEVLIHNEFHRPQPEQPAKKEPIVLKVENLTVKDEKGIVSQVGNCTFHICEKEILGIAGVAGNGQQALAESLVGIRPIASGLVFIDKTSIAASSVKDLISRGVTYIPEDRLQDGFLPTANVAQNLILGYHRLGPYSRKGFLDLNKIFKSAQELISEYNIMTQSASEAAANLSGGNIQRVMLARAFSHPTRLLIAHNPTRGLDIQSTDFVYSKLLERKEEGMASLLISEDLDELLRLCDRIGTIYKGEIVGIIARDGFDRYEIGNMMSGVRFRD